MRQDLGHQFSPPLDLDQMMEIHLRPVMDCHPLTKKKGVDGVVIHPTSPIGEAASLVVTEG